MGNPTDTGFGSCRFETVESRSRGEIGGWRAWWNLWVRSVFTLFVLVPLVLLAFVSRERQRRPPGEPAMWKLVLWLVLFLGGFALILLVPVLFKGH
jgi:NADH:ubiquinone oxidoreductase subunit 5 (subunit L)/multisubunit Na+/H+ antiporter MnhA subunit